MNGFGITSLGGIVAACLALTACGETAPRNSAGEGPTFVSLNPCIDAILVEVAAPGQVLALSHYSRDPAASSMDVSRAAQFGVTGGTAEEVIALQPDVVLASSFIAPATRAALERSGLRVETFGSPASVDGSLAQIRDLAMLTGQSEAGEALVDAIARDAPPLAGGDMTALLWQPGQIVAGETSLVAEHLRWAGFNNHAAARGLGQADHLTLEEIVADPPDVLLIAGDAPGQEHPLLARLGGTRVERFDPGLFYCAGPSILKAHERLREIRKAIGGEPT